jgi:hypothetical protein
VSWPIRLLVLKTISSFLCSFIVADFINGISNLHFEVAIFLPADFDLSEWRSADDDLFRFGIAS